MSRRLRPLLLVGALALTAAACSSAGASHGDDPVVGDGSAASIGTTTTATSSTTTTLPPTTTTAMPPTTVPAPPPPPAGSTRTITDPMNAPFATVGQVVLIHPSSAVEHIGFHQSSNDGAQELTILPSAVRPTVLRTRDRDTPPQTAADVVVQPGTQVRAPVSGTVIKAGAYRLYCAYDDETVEIQPDAQPAWKVVVLHLQGVLVTAGQKVVAGVTPIAQQAHQLPFASQVDVLKTASPAWPHVHIEVDDPAIPDKASKGDSCGL